MPVPSPVPPERARPVDVASAFSAPARRPLDATVAASRAPDDLSDAVTEPTSSEGEPLWLAFVNTDEGRRGDPPPRRSTDVLRDFDAFVDWLGHAGALDAERAAGIRRRAVQQPAAAAAALVDARRVRAALRALAERGAGDGTGHAGGFDAPLHLADGRAVRDVVRDVAMGEINRVLGRSAGTRRVELRPDGTFARTFVTVGDAFAGLMVPVVDSAVDTLVTGGLPRVRRCADARCPRVFLDTTKNGRRRWCDMATCGNRAKAQRHRDRAKELRS